MIRFIFSFFLYEEISFSMYLPLILLSGSKVKKNNEVHIFGV